jgi:serine/threonine protein kinase
MAKTCPSCNTTYPDSVAFCPNDGSGLISTAGGDGLIGEVIADMYLVTSLLGQGGMGTVYHAQHVRLPLQVAIKILHANRSSDPAQAIRFRQEAESASRIDHDRVARVYDFGTTASGEAYIAMEYVPGRTLATLLEERGAFDAVEAGQIIFMTAEGLDAAHRIGIIHRDLKPENIMIVDDAEGSIRVKVLDFGIAKMMSGPKSATLTQHGFIIGSPSFMSPEQVMGETLDARSDVYSLALLAFVLLTGVRPFSGNTPEAEMLGRLTTPPKKLAEVAPTVAWPAELQALFDRTLSSNVDVRPARARIFADEFFNVINSWKGATRPPGMISGSTSKPPFTLATAVAGADPAMISAELAPPGTVAPRSRKWVAAGAGLAIILAGSAAAYELSAHAPSNARQVASAGTIADSTTLAAPPTAAARSEVANNSGGKPADKILAPKTPEQAAPVTVDLSKTDPRKPSAPVVKPVQPALTPRTVPAAHTPAIDSAALRATAASAAANVAKAPVSVAEAKPSAPDASSKTPAELSNEAKTTLRNYADAIESHQTTRLRSAYPGITSSQVDTWGTFFQFASNIKITLNRIDFADALTATPGSKIHATVMVTINYRNDSNRKDEHDSAKWQAVLARSATGWQLVDLQ